MELKEKKHRLEDAISATRAAIEEGIIPGGGSALVHIAADPRTTSARPVTRRPGSSVVRSALVSPARWIAENAGAGGRGRRRPRSPSSAVGQGFNAATGEYGDLVAQGVIDPVKVTRSAVLNAASIAAMLLTTEALVAEQAGGGGRGGRGRPRPLARPRALR